MTNESELNMNDLNMDNLLKMDLDKLSQMVQKMEQIRMLTEYAKCAINNIASLKAK